MFLPWYQQTGFLVRRGGTQKVEDSLIAFQSWGFVEASILLVALAVLLLLFLRGERRAFHLPFGDGLVIAAGGALGDVPRLLPPGRQARRQRRPAR